MSFKLSKCALKFSKSEKTSNPNQSSKTSILYLLGANEVYGKQTNLSVSNHKNISIIRLAGFYDLIFHLRWFRLFRRDLKSTQLAT